MRWGVVVWIEHPLLMLEVRGLNPGHSISKNTTSLLRSPRDSPSSRGRAHPRISELSEMDGAKKSLDLRSCVEGKLDLGYYRVVWICNWANNRVFTLKEVSWGRQGQRRLKLENGHYGNVLVKMNESSEWQGVCDDGWNTPTTGGGLLARKMLK